VKRLFTMLIVLSMAFTMAWAQNDLNLTFEDDSDLANWSHHDEANVWTAEAWDATAGVDGSGALVFTDAGFTFLVKRPVTATLGTAYTVSIDIKNPNWETGNLLNLMVQGLSTSAPSVDVAGGSTEFVTYTLSGVADESTAGYIRLYTLGSSAAPTVTIDNVVFDDDAYMAPAVFFSEYIEGSSNNKAMEIYNGTDAEIDLADYVIYGNYNGNPWSEIYPFAEGTMVAAGDVYVFSSDQAVQEILDEADVTFAYGAPWYVTAFNGDDVRALGHIHGTDTTIIDLFGAYDMVDPGDGWEVAGIANATKDHTLIRKMDVTMGNTDWAASAGTDADNSEWVVMDNNFFGSLGSHPYDPVGMVTFSVDMSFQISLGNFIAGTDFLDVAGTLNEWGGGDVLTDDDADGIYTGTFEVAVGPMEYKFRINGNWDTSESLDANRSYDVVEGENILPTVYYSNQEPVETTDVEVYIQVDMTVQLLNGNFDPTNGDLIVIRGSHANYGNWGGAIEMVLDPEQTNVYTHLSSFDAVPIGSGQEYKFVILTGGDVDAAIWEGSPNRTWTATGDEADSDENGYGEILQDVQYFADVTPDDIITQNVTVNWTVDISSAYHALAAGDTLIDTQTGSDDITAWDQVNGVAINGVLSQWWDWGNDPTCVGDWAMTMVDEVTYTFSYLYTAGQAKAQQYKYGINSLDNEAGFGQNREFTIDDAAAVYDMPTDCFGSHNTDEALPFPVECAPIANDPTVTFSVDMSFQITLGNFVAGTDFLDVAGTLNEWGGGDLLTDDDADGIYTGTFTVAEGAMEYKFRINGNWDTSENLPANRMYTVVAGENVLPTVWYGDQEPSEPTNVEVYVQVDMTVQLLNGNFDPSNGDLIVIRGGHENYGNWGGAIEMVLDPEQTNIYTHLSSFDNVPVGSGYEYKFVILTGGSVDAAIWEGSPNRTWIATGEEEDSDENGYGEIFQEVAYFADVTPDDIITQNVTVTWNLDITSAYRALANGDTLIDTQTGSDDISDWSQVNGVAINGVLSQWWDWGNDVTCVGDWAMTQTDDEGFMYTFSYLYTAGQAKSQQYKYGINSLDNEAGFGQNREFTIDDAAATYVMDTDCFGEHNTDDNLPLPQECGPVSVASLPGIPTSYALSQNYPNPFNPTTTIAFALPEANNVVLTIYNALGQEIRTLKTDYLNAGNYSVTWDGLDNSGASIPSGLYIYTMTAGDQNFSKKMLMLK